MSVDPIPKTDPANELEETAPPPADTKVVPAADLFEGKREILIEHAGVRYRLRLTRRNRLILQK